MLKVFRKGKYIAKIGLLILSILLLILGIWQIKRGLHKQYLLDIGFKAQQYNIIDIIAKANSIGNILYQKVNLTGNYTKPTFFVFRQHEGKSGYWVVNPFIESSSRKYILVAHKFIYSPKNKLFLTLDELNKIYNIDNENNLQNLNTYVIKDLPRAFNLTQDNFDTGQDSLLVQNITIEQYNKHFHNKVLNFTLVLQGNQDNNLPQLKQSLTTRGMTPDKHYGYALTWLGLFAVSLYFLLFKR